MTFGQVLVEAVNLGGALVVNNNCDCIYIAPDGCFETDADDISENEDCWKIDRPSLTPGSVIRGFIDWISEEHNISIKDDDDLIYGYCRKFGIDSSYLHYKEHMKILLYLKNKNIK